MHRRLFAVHQEWRAAEQLASLAEGALSDALLNDFPVDDDTVRTIQARRAEANRRLGHFLSALEEDSAASRPR